MIRLAFLRHGVTSWNREGRIQGRTDIPLDPEGRDRLARLTLPPDWRDATLHASPLARAMETASLLCPGRPIHTDSRLIEMDWGAWEGLRGHDLRADPASGYRDLEHWGWDFRPPNGESPADVRERLRGWLDSIQAQSPLPPGERVRVRGEHGEDSRDSHATHPPHPAPLPGGERESHLIVTHIGVIRAALALAWGWDFRGPPPVPVKRNRLYVLTLATDGTLRPTGPEEGLRLS
ncbi:phosphoglycerate mutase [Azospirillum sp. TSH100]|uniref:histidine phosphatase family protein n=1 Tax=Azospirillum sp. TSH100 TaxID=652764 RepID=UPI000D6043FA|nr:histidine phosphatase family protein [Azospirillum sp. TSH100]PWC84200.1 phosphoglycerate mutase [Azospirillum sp. TSH100]QCG91188.1 histidine phosphatase family protein [Azospirillum sp. TSH100]